MLVKTGKYLNILIADDAKEIASLASSVLQYSGHSVDVASNGLEALVKITKNPRHYDLLITDNNMPKLSGVQLIQQIRKDGFPGKIIVASGCITQDMSKAYQSLHIDKILQKPYGVNQLLKAVEDLDIERENQD